MDYLQLSQRLIPVCANVDLCVVGGGVTGVFAAVRAARLGMKVALVERFSSLGGMATNGHVNIWHSLYNTSGEKQIIAGLTEEDIQMLKLRGRQITKTKWTIGSCLIVMNSSVFLTP